MTVIESPPEIPQHVPGWGILGRKLRLCFGLF